MSSEINTIEDWNTLLNLAEEGNNSAQLEVAMYFENGNDFVTINNAEAFKWTKLAYENGKEDAIVRYADYLSAGNNCDKNIEHAVQLYARGIELGFGEASFNLGVEYRNKQNFKTAFEYYQRANEMSAGAYQFDDHRSSQELLTLIGRTKNIS